MPQYCSVPGCRNEKGGHLFPTSPKRKLAWRVAISRMDPKTKNLWNPGDYDVVCQKHFRNEDYWPGKRHLLRDGVVPSIFAFKDNHEQSESQTERGKRAAKRKRLAAPDAAKPSTELKLPYNEQRTFVEVSTQCSLISGVNSTKGYSIHSFRGKDDSVQYLTGFDDFQHFMWFFGILKLSGLQLDYRCTKVEFENQLFLVMMKLRQSFDHKFLAILFDISETTVSKIFLAWIRFMYHRLKD